MKFKGKVRVTLHASCGWIDDTVVKFNVDCEPDPDVIQMAVEREYLGLAERWHHQEHGNCPGTCYEEFHWG